APVKETNISKLDPVNFSQPVQFRLPGSDHLRLGGSRQLAGDDLPGLPLTIAVGEDQRDHEEHNRRAALRHPAETVRLILDRLDGAKAFMRKRLLPAADVR